MGGGVAAANPDVVSAATRRRRQAVGSVEFAAADAEVRQTVATMQAKAEAELADPTLATPCRKVLVSLQEHWPGLTRFVDDLRIPWTTTPRSGRRMVGPWGKELLWLWCVVERSPGGGMFCRFATLSLAKLNIRKWLTWYLRSAPPTAAKPPGT